MISGLTSEGRYMPSRWAVITSVVALLENPSCTCMLNGVAVMMKLITAYDARPHSTAKRNAGRAKIVRSGTC